jgi:hypothetical protein
LVAAHFPLDLLVETTLLKPRTEPAEAMDGNSPVLPLGHSSEHVVLVAMLRLGRSL